MLKRLKENIKYLEIPDVTTQLFLLLLSLISIIFVNNLPDRILIPVINIILCLLIIYFVSHYEKKTDNARLERSVSRFLRFWYPGIVILICFKEIYVIMISTHNVLYDDYLIKIDRWLFGTDPALYLSDLTHPLLTEILQIVYGLFYLMPLIYAMELYLWHRYEELKYAFFVVFLGFYLSFLGYLLVPAIGPRFTVFNFLQLGVEMPGLFFADIIRYLIDIGESIPQNVHNPEIYAQRDAFPSGHTIIMILITYLSHKIKSKSFYFYLPYCMVLIFSTVYLRYHYVIDLIAAVPVVLVTIFIANKLYAGKINFGSGNKIDTGKKQRKN